MDIKNTIKNKIFLIFKIVIMYLGFDYYKNRKIDNNIFCF